MNISSDIKTAMYQNMIQRQRQHNYNWPGKAAGTPAVTLYPNVLAEIDASGMWLWCPAQHAGVSEEILAAVLEDGEEMSLREMNGLCRLYGRELSYMVAPVLAIIDPATNKGRARRHAMEEMLAQADGLAFAERWRIESVLFSLGSGQAVTYAAYRQAMGALQCAMHYHHFKPRCKQMRLEAQS